MPSGYLPDALIYMRSEVKIRAVNTTGGCLVMGSCRVGHWVEHVDSGGLGSSFLDGTNRFRHYPSKMDPDLGS